MQLLNFNFARDSAQTIPPSVASKSTHMLTYRGASYELSMSSFRSQAGADELTGLLSQSLVYRGVRYAIAVVTNSTVSTSSTVQRLCYRGVPYAIHIA